MRIRSLFPFLLLLSACGPDGDSSPGGGGIAQNPSSLPAFAGYCTGLLKTPQVGMLPAGPSAWISFQGNQADLPPGTEVLLAESFGRIEGYAILLNGTPSKVDADFQTGLLKDVDYSSGCPAGAKTAKVLLGRSTFFADKSMTGQACPLEAGTVLTSFSFSGNGQTAVVKDPKIKEVCGLDEAHSKDIQYADLFLAE